jgi:hypothetical protein
MFHVKHKGAAGSEGNSYKLASVTSRSQECPSNNRIQPAWMAKSEAVATIIHNAVP